MELIIIGAGGFAKQVIDVAQLNNYKIYGIIDDLSSEGLYNYPILGNINDLDKILENQPQLKVFCGIGDIKTRERIFNLFPYRFVNCIHPSSIISKYSSMGIGNYIGPGVCIMPDVVIGNNNIIDPLVVLSHDVKIGNHNHLAAHCCLLGKVSIKDCNLIGSNSTILPKINLGSNNILGAGAVLTKNKENNKILVGIPAKERCY
jgi:sugar O-acyltransferase (sialic acid O-acetyltransferase NeuD family)